MTFIDDNGLVQFSWVGSRARTTWIVKDRQCEMCGSKYRVIPDHCHRHGWIRGWLCNICNKSISLWEQYIDCLECVTNPGEWHSCTAAKVKFRMKHRQSSYEHMIKCPDCKPAIEALMKREIEATSHLPNALMRTLGIEFAGEVFARYSEAD